MRCSSPSGVVVVAVWAMGIALGGCDSGHPGQLDPDQRGGQGGAGAGQGGIAGQEDAGQTDAVHLDPYPSGAAGVGATPHDVGPLALPAGLAGRGGADRSDAGPADVDQRDPMERLLALAEGVTVLQFKTVAPDPRHDPNVNVTVTDPSVARDVCLATVALPVMPPGTYNCFADFGIRYELWFFDPATSASPVIVATLRPGGCLLATITGGSDTLQRWTINAGGYWEMLAAALGVPRETLIK